MNTTIDELKAEDLRAKLGSYNEQFAKMLRDYAGNDTPGKVFAAEIRKAEDLVSKAASGGINLRRGEIIKQVQELIQQAVQAHHDARRQAADDLMQIMNDYKENQSKPSDQKRLADLMETQLRLQAMSDDELMKPVLTTASERGVVARALTFTTPTALDATISELSRRGHREQADLLRETYRDVPRQAIGDPKAAHLVQDSRQYAQRVDGDTVLLHDGKAFLGIVASEVVDLSPLARVPE